MKRSLDLSRLQRGELIAAAGGLLLIISLFLPWFGVDVKPGGGGVQEHICGNDTSCTAWQTFNILDFLLVAAGAAPLILIWIIVRGHELSWPPGEVTAIVGITASALIVYNGVIDRVGTERDFVSLDVGWYLGFVATLVILVGAALSRFSRGGDVRRPPGTF
jgi:hypothetical protein